MLLHTWALALLTLKRPAKGFVSYERGARGAAVVIDAGSTGSRAVIFDIVLDHHGQDDTTLYPKILLPLRNQKVADAVVNLLHSYFDCLQTGQCVDEEKAEEHSGLLAHFRALREYVDDNVAPEHRGSTVILFRGTAGFRLVDEATLERYAEKVDAVLRREFHQYAITPYAFRVYSGAEEAAAGFIALKALVSSDCIDEIHNDVIHEGLVVRYLNPLTRGYLGLKECTRGQPLYMFEVGGTSSQVGAELLEATDPAFKHMRDVDTCGFVQLSASDPSMSLIHYKGHKLPIVLRSFLGQGRSMAVMNYLRMLAKSGERHVHAACLPRGVNVEILDNPAVVLNLLRERDPENYFGSRPLAIGTSDYALCRRQVEELVDATLDGKVAFQPGALLYGTENFVYLIRDMGLPVDGTFTVTPRIFYSFASIVCPQDKTTLATFVNGANRIQHLCFGLNFVATLAQRVLGLPENEKMVVTERIHDTQASWAIGTVLLELPTVLRDRFSKISAQAVH
ncbi:adenosine-diphosphatase, putative [Babesia caballi]|uniref:Adenosine-diphosphatase, putative n=1 Tax=Babesia caballi TaxID=5871 RepID=A0AAV4LQR0_BABCB|nr:adenosine-diphosphatase, putative [Babesia caballi]